jgi:hypothetical protein
MKNHEVVLQPQQPTRCLKNAIMAGKTSATLSFAVSNDLLQHWHNIACTSLLHLKDVLTMVYSSCQLASLQLSSP